MGFFDDVGDFVSGAADAVGGAVQDAANAVGGAVSDAVETVGNAVEDGLDAVAGVVDDIPIVGDAAADVLEWTGDVVSSAFDFAGGVVDGAFGIAGGVLGGSIKVIGGGVGGLLSWDADVFLEGLGDIGSSIGGGVVVIVGEAVSFVQTVLTIQEERPLTADERAILERVFRGSIALHNVRLVLGNAGLFGINDRPFTLCNTIYLKERDPAKEPELLVHECTHVWQYQHRGPRYTTDALTAQWFVDNAYSWEAEIARGNTTWVEFNGEAQAAFLEDIYTGGEIVEPLATGNGAFYDADGVDRVGRFTVGRTDHTQRANDAVATVRGAFSLRLSSLWS